MKFTYSGYDRAGKPLKGLMEGADHTEVQEQLRRQGVFVMEISAAEAGGMVLGDMDRYRAGVSLRRGSRLERTGAMLRHLSLLVGTGTPVVDALVSLEKQTPQGEWRKVLGQVRTKVEEGRALSDAMNGHPEYFDAVCRSLVAAGEAGGSLDAMLERLAHLTRQQIRIRKAVAGAMVYPVLLICVAGSVTATMVTFVLPRFEGLFKTLDTALPPLTAVLMKVSHVLRDHWAYVLGGIVLVVTFLAWYTRTKEGRRAVHRLAVCAPMVGRVTRGFAAAQIVRILGTLLHGKVPMLEAIALTRHATKNAMYLELMARTEDAVVRGESLSAAMADHRLMTPAVIEAVRSGERSGRLSQVMVTIADHMDEDNEQTVKTLTGLLEPVILLVMGVIVGTIAVGMMLPLFDLTAAGGGGAR